MNTQSNRLFEHIFFFAILAFSGYLVWRLLVPFLGALALAAIVVTICYPIYERMLAWVPRKNQSLAAIASIALVIIIIVIPLFILGSFIFKEALSIYALVNESNSVPFLPLQEVEAFIQRIIPNFSIEVSNIVEQTAAFVVNHLISFFAATANTIFLFFIALFASYYFFKDGRYFTRYLINLSPLNDVEDEKILQRLALAVRSVALGTLTIAIIQGILTAIGLSLFGFERAVLWGSLAALGALVPGLGTAIVLVPAVVYLFLTGAQVQGMLLIVWGVLAVGLVDNILGPHLMSRGNNLHPLVILLAVLGGLALMGPIGFILGPVIISLFLVLLEIYISQFKNREH